MEADGPRQEGVPAFAAADHDELADLGGAGYLWRREPEEVGVLVELLGGQDDGLFLVHGG